MISQSDPADIRSIDRDMHHICHTIGRRIAGSPGEKKAAQYVARRFRGLGLENVRILPFPCKRWIPGPGRLTLLDRPRRIIPCIPTAHSAATPPEGVEGDLIIFEPLEYENGLPDIDLDGKIGLFYGSYGQSAKLFAAFHNSPLAGLVFVDTRLQTDWPIANGMGPTFMPLVRKPMACVSSMHAWEIARRHGHPSPTKAVRLRLVSRGRIVDSTSFNVVAELPADNPRARVIGLCAHLDSVSVGVGADDNASGCAAILECARRLRAVPRKHTIRFLAFGAEEHLSLGAHLYAREQSLDLSRVAFVINFDAIAARLGRAHVLAAGTAPFYRYLRSILGGRIPLADVLAGVTPYQDAFPFSAVGIPSLWFNRTTHNDTYWYHHSPHNDLDACPSAVIARAAEAGVGLVTPLLCANAWPFPRRVSSPLLKQAARYLRELFL